MAPELEPLRTAVRPELDDKYRAREAALPASRQAIRRCANAIRALHRGEAEKADSLIDEARALLDGAVEATVDHPDIRTAGFVSDALKEYAEACTFRAVVNGAPLPLPEEIGVDVAPYLNGLGETVGEMRRRMLDLLRDERLDEAEATLQAMDRLVDFLAELDYPDGMTGGLRRTTDVARALVERSRSDLTTTVIQERLRRDLRNSTPPA